MSGGCGPVNFVTMSRAELMALPEINIEETLVRGVPGSCGRIYVQNPCPECSGGEHWHVTALLNRGLGREIMLFPVKLTEEKVP